MRSTASPWRSSASSTCSTAASPTNVAFIQADAATARPAAQRGRMVNRAFGDPASQLRERHDAADFLTNTQDKRKPQR